MGYQGNSIKEKAYLDNLYRRLFLAEKGAINDAIFKGLLPDDVASPYLQRLDEKLLSVNDEG